MPTNVGTLFGRLTLNTTQWQKGLNKAATQLQIFAARANAVGKKLQSFITTPLLVAGGAAGFFAGRFEAEMTKIETLVGVNRDLVKQWSEELLRMAPAVGKGPGELAKALFVVTSAGERTQNALNIVRESAKAAAIGLGDTTEVARTVTAVMQAYGAENISASQAVEVLVKTVREGNLEASELAGTLGRVIGIASQLGVEFSEVGSFIATFTRLGVDSAEAVTALRGTLNLFLKATEQGKGALRGYGLAAEDVIASMDKRGLTRTLIDLLQEIEGNNEALGRILPNVRALAGVLGVAGAQALTASDIAQKLSDSLLIVEDGFERTGETAKQKFAQALAAMEVALIRLGNILLPTFKKLADGIVRLLERWSELPRVTQANIVVFGLAAAAIGPLLRLISLFTSGLSLLTQTVGFLVPAFGPLFRALAMLPGLLTGANTAFAVFTATVRGLAVAALPILGIALVALGGAFLGAKLQAAALGRIMGSMRDDTRELETGLRKLTEAQRDQVRATIEQTKARRQEQLDAVLAKIQETERALEQLSATQQSSVDDTGFERARAAEQRSLRDLREEAEELTEEIERLGSRFDLVDRVSERARADLQALATQIRELNAQSLRKNFDQFGSLLEGVGSNIIDSFRRELIDEQEIRSLFAQLGNALGEAMKRGLDPRVAADITDNVVAELNRMAVESDMITSDFADMLGARFRNAMDNATSGITGSINIVGELMGQVVRLGDLFAGMGQNAVGFGSAFEMIGQNLITELEEANVTATDLMPVLRALGEEGFMALARQQLGADDLVDALEKLVTQYEELRVAGTIGPEEAARAIDFLNDRLEILRSGGAQAVTTLITEFARLRVMFAGVGSEALGWLENLEEIRDGLIAVLREATPDNLPAALGLVDQLAIELQKGLRRGWIEGRELNKIIEETIVQLRTLGRTGELDIAKVNEAVDKLRALMAEVRADALKESQEQLGRVLRLLLTTGLAAEDVAAAFDVAFRSLQNAVTQNVDDVDAVADALGNFAAAARFAFAAGALKGGAFRDIMEDLRQTMVAAAVAANWSAERINELNMAFDAALADVADSDWILDVMHDLGRAAARELADGLINGFKDAKDIIKRALQVLLEAAIIKAVQVALGIASPSRVAIGWGRAVGQGLAIGLSGSAAQVRQATGRMLNSVTMTGDRITELFGQMAMAWQRALASRNIAVGSMAGEVRRSIEGASAAFAMLRSHLTEGLVGAGNDLRHIMRGVLDGVVATGGRISDAFGRLATDWGRAITSQDASFDSLTDRVFSSVKKASEAIVALRQRAAQPVEVQPTIAMPQLGLDQLFAGVQKAGEAIKALRQRAADPVEVQPTIAMPQLGLGQIFAGMIANPAVANMVALQTTNAMPVVQLNLPPLDFTKLPRPLTPTEAAANRQWAELVVQTIRGAEVGGFRTKQGPRTRR